MLLLAWIVRVLVLLIAIRLLVRFVGGIMQGLNPASAARTGGSARRRGGKPAVALMKDPVCGTYVVPERALTKQAQGTTFYFCSEACRAAFDKNRVTSRSA